MRWSHLLIYCTDKYLNNHIQFLDHGSYFRGQILTLQTLPTLARLPSLIGPSTIFARKTPPPSPSQRIPFSPSTSPLYLYIESRLLFCKRKSFFSISFPLTSPRFRSVYIFPRLELTSVPFPKKTPFPAAPTLPYYRGDTCTETASS